MRQFIILFKKDMLELWRTKKILALSIVFIIFALSSPLLAKITPELLKSMSEVEMDVPDAVIADSYLQYVGNTVQLCVFTIIIALGGSIVKERKNGIYNNLLNNGVKKSNFILSKVKTQVLVVTVIYVISCLLFSICNVFLFNEFLVQYSLLSFLALYIYLLFVISVVNFYSAIAKSNIVGIILSFTTVISIVLFDLFKFGKYLPNSLVNISSLIFTDKTYVDFAYQTMGITLLISVALTMLAIKLCGSKE